MTVATPTIQDAPRAIEHMRTRADRIYRCVATAGGLATLVVLFLIGLFLFLRSASTFRQYGLSFFTTTVWNPAGDQAGVAALLYGTVEVAMIAMVLGGADRASGRAVPDRVCIGARRPADHRGRPAGRHA